MAVPVNLVTGLIVFKTIKVFLEIKATSVERTLCSTKGIELRHIIFIIIESGMALFVSQLLRSALVNYIFDYIVSGINKMFNVIIRSDSFILSIIFTWIGHRTNNSFGASLNEIVQFVLR